MKKHPDPGIVNARSNSTHTGIRTLIRYTQAVTTISWLGCVNEADVYKLRKYILPNGAGDKSIYLIITILRGFNLGSPYIFICTRGDDGRDMVLIQSSNYVLQCCNAAMLRRLHR